MKTDACRFGFPVAAALALLLPPSWAWCTTIVPREPRYHVVVARVMSVGDSVREYPRVGIRLSILERLRGNPVPGMFVAWWDSTDTEGDPGPLGQMPSRGSMARVTSPRVGDDYILTLISDIQPWLIARGARRLTPGNRSQVVEWLRDIDRRAVEQERDREERARRAERNDLQSQAAENISDLVAASTDVVIATLPMAMLNGDVTEFRIQEGLLRSGVDPREPMELPWMLVPLEDRERFYLRAGADPSGQVQSPPWRFLLFLRRGPLIPVGVGEHRIYRLSDRSGGMLRADPDNVARARRAIAHRARRGGESSVAESRCGAPIDAFVNLPPELLRQVHGKLTSIKPFTYPQRTCSILFGCAPLDDRSRGEFGSCALPFERYGNDFLMIPYAFQLSPVAMRAALRALASLPQVRAGRSSSEGVVSLTLRGPVGGDRVFEVILDDRTLRTAIEKILTATGNPRSQLAGWLKYDYDKVPPPTISSPGGR
jgi:hypothetical protein